MFCLLQILGRGQNTFDNYYNTGYHNNKSSNVITEPDSSCVFVNYIIDSTTQRLDMGFLRLDKNGNEVIKNSFNMFNGSFYSFVSGMKNFIEATPSSYFLSGSYFTGNDQNFILAKINRTTLDTIKTFIYTNPGFHAILGITKLNDNAYLLIGNTGNSATGWPIMFRVDSNLTIVQTINIATSNNFFINDAIYNPVNKKILLAGGTGSGQYLSTFMHLDTLGNIKQIAFGPSYQTRSILQVYYRALDTSYIAVGYYETGTYSNIGLTKLCIGKLDLNLHFKWEKTYGATKPGNGLVDAILLDDGSIVVSGAYSPQTSAPLLTNTNGIIMKVDKNGNLKWAREYDHTSQSTLAEMFYGIDKTLNKGFILCGNIIAPPSNKSQAWAVKTDSMGCVTPGCANTLMQVDSIVYPPPPPPPPIDTTLITVGLKEAVFEKNNLRIYPNPVSQVLKIAIANFNTAEKKEYRLEIINTLGQSVLKSKAISSLSEIDVGALQNGIYFLQVFNQNKLLVTEKFVKE